MPRRRSRRPPAWLRRARARLFRLLLCAAVIGCGAALGVNMAVRSLGGDVNLLSVVRLRDRARALYLFGSHMVLAARHSEGEREVREYLEAAARRHAVSPRLVLAVAFAESGFVPTRISGTGAMGLMQLMPDTACELGLRDPFDPRANADAGVRYLKQLLASYRGDVRRALAAYNAGPARVLGRAWNRELPDETRAYVSRIVSRL